MKKTVLTAVAAAVAAATFAAPAFAQSGSRLCGWVSETPMGAIGILYEARQKDSSYSKQCDTVISEVEDQIKKDPQLSKMTWNKVHKDTCESVGEKFKSGDHPNNDMCDYMEAKQVYQVQKSNKDNKTVYAKK